MSVLSKTDTPNFEPFPSKRCPSSPQLLSTEMSNFEAPSSSSSSAPLSSPLHRPPFLCLPLILHLRLASSCLQIGGLNSCAAIIGQDIDIKELIIRSKTCVNEDIVREKDSAYKLLSYPLHRDVDSMLFDRELMDTRRWPPVISYKIKRFVAYARSAPELCEMGDLSLFVCVQQYSDGYAIDLPGGRRNLGESMEEALRRETIEESGVILFSKNDEDLCCQLKIDEFIDSDMCFHVIHQDVYHIGSDGIGRIPVPYTTVLSGGSEDSRADDLVVCCDLPNSLDP
eukprot:CAMPEP_0119051406 /NCGR_PEP_ID=MMETSP1177-20130426/73029_1 /TAXON_ID=2985 /ORGANISM="Ochromonas sp, Strain CCMP1899" /LENGTH=283 /DNA_ID=CAMNT_0007030593 /DNA_START=585 /DNA_END=1436 /DNA_ORIENTATION=-